MPQIATHNPVMKISNDNLSRQQATTVNQLNDLISLLKRLDSLPARVINNAQGQLLLATQLGNIQPESRLPLQPGQQVIIRLDPSTGQPTVSPANTDTATIRLAAEGNRELIQLLNPQKSTLAKVVNQSQASTQIRLNGTQLAVPQIQGLKPGQLLSVRLNAADNQIELQPLQKKPLLKALLTQLTARTQAGNGGSTALTDLFRNLSQISAGKASLNAQGSVGKSNSTTAPASPVVNPSRAELPPSPSLLQLLPQLSTTQSKIINQWIAPFIQQQATADLSQTQWPNPLRLLQQISNGEFPADKLERLLNSLLPVRTESSAAQQPQATTQESRLLQEMQLLQGREAAKLVEQIGNQTQAQRTSVSLQQEIQQPLAFALSLPVMEGKQIRQLDIKVEQRNQAKDPDKQGWDARLSFEFGAMGMVSCHIFLLGDQVSSSFYCELDATRQQFEFALPSFRQQLIKAGFVPGELNSYAAPARPESRIEPVQISESILDIKV